MTTEKRCACGRTDCDQLNRNFHRMLAANPDLLPEMSSVPRYHYWTYKNKQFHYTTERADEGKYWAMIYRWSGKVGTRRGVLIKTMGFRQRWKAKQRAYDWYAKASGAGAYDWHTGEEK